MYYIPIYLNRSQAGCKNIKITHSPGFSPVSFQKSRINSVIFPTSNYSTISNQFPACIILAFLFPSFGEMIGVVSVGVFGPIFSYVRGI